MSDIQKAAEFYTNCLIEFNRATLESALELSKAGRADVLAALEPFREATFFGLDACRQFFRRAAAERELFNRLVDDLIPRLADSETADALTRAIEALAADPDCAAAFEEFRYEARKPRPIAEMLRGQIRAFIAKQRADGSAQ